MHSARRRSSSSSGGSGGSGRGSPGLPTWLHTSRTTMARAARKRGCGALLHFPTHGRGRVAVLAACCMLLGWSVVRFSSPSASTSATSSSPPSELLLPAPSPAAASASAGAAMPGYAYADADADAETPAGWAGKWAAHVASWGSSYWGGSGKDAAGPTSGREKGFGEVEDEGYEYRYGEYDEYDGETGEGQLVEEGDGIADVDSDDGESALAAPGSRHRVRPGRPGPGRRPHHLHGPSSARPDRPRIGKVSILFGGSAQSRTYERALATHARHDRAHGYPLFLLREGILDDTWSKPAFILSVLLRELAKPAAERLQWLLWVDADTIVLNPRVGVDVFLPPAAEDGEDGAEEAEAVQMLVTHDWNGLNNGVFPVRVGPWAVELFSAIVSFRYYRPDHDLGWGRDQAAMGALLAEPRFRAGVVRVPQRWFNAYVGEHNETLQPHQVRRGDLLVHFAGLPDRNRLMAAWLRRAEARALDWEMAVRHTTYLAEARDFWAAWRADRARRRAEVEARLDEFGDRLDGLVREGLLANLTAAKATLDDASVREPEVIQGCLSGLQEHAHPLTQLAADADQSLATAAHEAIFDAEATLTAAAARHAGSGMEAATTALRDAVDRLRAAMLQQDWSRKDVRARLRELADARRRVEGEVEKEKETEERGREKDKKIGVEGLGPV